MPKFYMTCTVVFDQQFAISIEAENEEQAKAIAANSQSRFRQDLDDEIQRDLPSGGGICSISFSKPVRRDDE